MEETLTSLLNYKHRTKKYRDQSNRPFMNMQLFKGIVTLQSWERNV